ncbi:pentatricopeptide repeat-containing protein At1g06270 [Euphorbia lathyris]|uniref:pentatricopeptide repeat-containing protein At1g06270 n=1 Tax=Euphorbia lathyris TaxID=212925 RepID=UPI003313985F
MVIGVAKFFNNPLHSHHFRLHLPLVRAIASLEQTIETAVETKAYHQIPDLISSLKQQSPQNSNPFSFLSDLTLDRRTQVTDEILQSFIAFKPRSLLQPVYSHLLTYALQSPNPLPLSFAILQRTLRSGFSPVPQTRLLLSSAWLHRRGKLQSVASILLEMESIGYNPDSGLCNYLLYSLCAVDQLQEAVKVLKGMGKAGCVPDLAGYSTVVNSFCRIRKSAYAVEMMKEMVVKFGLNPRQGTVVKLAAALRANREIWIAVDMIEFLEKEGCNVGFESYELVLEGCLECKEYILAGKVVMRMTDKEFIPYIKARLRVVEGLVAAGEWELACSVRHRFAKLNS